MVWIGNDLKDYLVPTPLALLKTPSNLALYTSRDGKSTTSLSNLCQCLATLAVKNFFCISNLNLISSSLNLLLLSCHFRHLDKVPVQPDLLDTLPLMQPSAQLTFWAASTHCQLMLGFSSTNTLNYFVHSFLIESAPNS